jgi:hypothetical protein
MNLAVRERVAEQAVGNCLPLVLVRAIRSTKDLASIRALRVVTRETMERIQERACQREVEK